MVRIPLASVFMRECGVIETKEEQCFVIWFYMRRGKSATATFQKLKESYGKQCLSRATILRKHAAFTKEGRESAKEKPLQAGRRRVLLLLSNNGTGALKMVGDISKNWKLVCFFLIPVFSKCVFTQCQTTIIQILNADFPT